MKAATHLGKVNGLVKHPWARDYMPGGPLYNSTENIKILNDQLKRFGDPQGHLFAAIAPKSHALSDARRNTEYVTIWRIGEKEGTAMLCQIVRDFETKQPLFREGALEPMIIKSLRAESRLTMTPDEVEKFHEELNDFFQKYCKEESRRKCQELTEAFVEGLTAMKAEKVFSFLNESKLKRKVAELKSKNKADLEAERKRQDDLESRVVETVERRLRGGNKSGASAPTGGAKPAAAATEL